jgi:hypothetical protein
MQNKYFDELLADFPEVQRDRYGLTFARDERTTEVARALSECGVVMLKDALPADVLSDCRRSFEDFTRSLPEESSCGSWHLPWLVRDDSLWPAAVILRRLIDSWAWRVIEDLCGSTDIAVLLSFCVAHHAIDTRLGAGAHQDAKVLPAELPLSMWIPLQGVVPLRTSGLGFLPPPPDRVLPTLPHNDIGPDYVLGNFDKAWVPSYAAGDLTIHSHLLPHFTTGYGTRSDRYSLEIRAMAMSQADPKLQDPAIYVSRRHGWLTFVDSRCSPATVARLFLAELSGTLD